MICRIAQPLHNQSQQRQGWKTNRRRKGKEGHEADKPPKWAGGQVGMAGIRPMERIRVGVMGMGCLGVLAAESRSPRPD
jgi:hypothetical protein